MTKTGIILIVCSAAIGATYCSGGGAALMNIFALAFFGLAAVAGFFVSLSVLFCMFCLPVIECARFVGVRLLCLTKRA